jgi:aminoglycoside phosphotransferase family enzyme/predicted kinase
MAVIAHRKAMTTSDQIERQEELIAALGAPGCYPHPVDKVRHIETHISHVLLTGSYAYKIKKPVNLGFLDFSTLPNRKFYCEEEVRLNRRLAPALYLDVVPIGGTPPSPVLGAVSGVIEYAVKMREFPQTALFDVMLGRGELTPEHIDALALQVAAFHQRAERADPQQPYGSAASIEAPMRQNFAQISALLESAEERAELARLEAWSLSEHDALVPLFAERQRSGFIRECHGDLHVGNIALVDGEVQIFDCIEFNPNLRWIDVANEIAFFVMDLEERGHPRLAYRFLNDYLEYTGDYAGVRLLRAYQVYRALVRAKVARIRAAQAHLSEKERTAALATYAAYMACARRLTATAQPVLVLMHGLAGSGKSTVAQALAQELPALRLRADVERKRLHHLQALQRSGSAVGAGLYSESATRATYEALARQADSILAAGHSVIVDAASLKRWQRNLLREVAGARGARFLTASCTADPALLRRRIREREQEGRDASEAGEAVLDHQIAGAESLGEDEDGQSIRLDTGEVSAEGAGQRVIEAIKLSPVAYSSPFEHSVLAIDRSFHSF